MQIEQYDKQHLNKLIQDSQRIAILPAKTNGADSFAAGVGLYFMLKQLAEEYNENQDNSNKKEVRLVYFGKHPEETSQIIKPEEVSDNISERELRIEVDYTNTPASNVSWTTDNDILVLKMGPVPQDFSLDRIRAGVVGFNFDLIIIIGAQNIQDLGTIYTNLEKELQNAYKINIDNNSNNKRYGVVNIIDPSAQTLSELIFKFAIDLKLVPNTKAAKALLKGITYREEKLVQ